MTKSPGDSQARLPRIFAAALLVVGLAATVAASSPDSSAASTASGTAAALSAALVRPGGVHRLGVQPAATTPPGYAPADLRSAYNLAAAAASGGKNATVAIIDVGNDATAAADLAVYRTQYGLPACTTASGCLRRVNEQGQAGPLPQDQSLAPFWPLDMDMVSAVCPNCRVLLIDADDADGTDLGTAVDSAVRLGAKYVVVGWDRGASSPTVAADASYFDHPGVAITVPAGNFGFTATAFSDEFNNYPATSPYVTSVGGTTLQRASNARGWTETVWAKTPSDGDQSTGSGCYDGYARPSWEVGAYCSGRNYNDVAADADPATGVAYYNTDPDYGAAGWGVGGGTTVSASIVGAVYALAGTPAADSYPASYPYLNPAALNPVTSGSNVLPGNTCAPAYLCTAGPGYNGPAGLGTPDGTGAFTAPASASVMMVGLTAQTARVLPATVSLRVPTEDSAANPMTFTATGLPPGLAINPATGLISGTIGSYYNGTTSVTATDATGATATTSFGWLAENAMSFPAVPTQQSAPGSAVSVTIKASDPEQGEPVSYAATGLPTGLSIDAATGVISGTVGSLISNSYVTLTATDGTGSSATVSFLWQVENTITVTAAGQDSIAAGATVSVPVSATDSAAGATLSFSATGLPPGLSINPASGAITGSTIHAGEYPVTVTATDEFASTGSATIDLDVTGKITITSPGNLATAAGQAVQVPFTVTNTADNDSPVYTLTGGPPGINVGWQSAVLTGWPAPAGTYKTTITAKGDYSGTASVSFTWTVKAAADTGPKGPVRLNLGGKCLDDTGDKSTNGNKVQIWTCNGGAGQNWTYAQDGTLRINGKCLDATGNGTKVGTKLQLWSCLNHTNQMWTAAYAAELAGAQSRLCLSDPASSTKNGTQVELGSCGKGANVQWTLPAGEIMSVVPGKCVTDAGGGTANGTAIVLEACANSAAQRWTFQPDGTLRIFGKCLSTLITGPGAGAVLEPCGNSFWHQWGFGDESMLGNAIGFADGDSYYDLEAQAAANGTQLTLGGPVGPGGNWFLW